jgi:hypothetical protein
MVSLTREDWLVRAFDVITGRAGADEAHQS